MTILLPVSAKAITNPFDPQDCFSLPLDANTMVISCQVVHRKERSLVRGQCEHNIRKCIPVAIIEKKEK